jgi:hypothetical protein
MARLIATALFASIFIVGIVHDVKAFGRIIVLPTKCHVLTTSVTVIDDVPKEIESSARRSENTIIIRRGYREYGLRLCGISGSCVNRESAHRIGTLIIGRNCGKCTLPKDMDCGVTLDNFPGRNPDISHDKLYLAGVTYIPFVEADPSHDKTWAERKSYVLLRRVNASQSGVYDLSGEDCLAAGCVSQDDGKRRQDNRGSGDEIISPLVNNTPTLNDQRHATIGGAIISIAIFIGIWAVWVVVSTPSGSSGLNATNPKINIERNKTNLSWRLYSTSIYSRCRVSSIIRFR